MRLVLLSIPKSYLRAEGLTPDDASERKILFGENSVDVKPPTFWHHLGERLSSPFTVTNLFKQVKNLKHDRGGVPYSM